MDTDARAIFAVSIVVPLGEEHLAPRTKISNLFSRTGNSRLKRRHNKFNLLFISIYVMIPAMQPLVAL